MTEDELVYTFALTYTPEALAGTPITRADGAIVGVQCHYQRYVTFSIVSCSKETGRRFIWYLFDPQVS